jgi:serine/threonine-protein kinase
MSMPTSIPKTDWDEIETALLGCRDKSVLPPWVKLPGLSTTILEFTRKAQDPEAEVDDLAAIVQRDATLTCLLLRHVNSAAMGVAHAATSVQEAIIRLGIRTCMLFLLTEGVKQVTSASKSRVINMPQLCCENLERGLLARRFAAVLKADAEVAFAGALLADCLLPVVTNAAAQTYFRFLEGQNGLPQPLTEFEDREFGWNHALATALLFAGWGFPPELVCCVAIHHRGLAVLDDARLKNTSAAAVALAALIPDQMRQVPAGLDQLRSLEARLPGFDLHQATVAVSEDCAKMLPSVMNLFPLARRCQQQAKKQSWFGRYLTKST